MKDSLSGRRLALLLRNDVLEDYRLLATIALTLAAVMLVGAVIAILADGGIPNYYTAWFTGLLFVGGAIAASRAFRELHDKSRNEAYLLLPASAVEKTLARLLLVTIGVVVALLLFTTVVSFAIEAGNQLYFGRGNAFFRPLDVVTPNLLAHFLVVQSLYFLGGAWFRKSHFIKTALSLAVIVLVLGAFATFLAWLLLSDHYFLDRSWASQEADAFDFTAVARAAQITYFAVLPPFCWFVAWLRVRETQVSYGV